MSQNTKIAERLQKGETVEWAAPRQLDDSAH